MQRLWNLTHCENIEIKVMSGRTRKAGQDELEIEHKALVYPRPWLKEPLVQLGVKSHRRARSIITNQWIGITSRLRLAADNLRDFGQLVCGSHTASHGCFGIEVTIFKQLETDLHLVPANRGLMTAKLFQHSEH